MRTLVVAAVLAAVLLVGGGGATGAEFITFNIRASQAKYIDLGHKGPDAGDTLITKHALTDRTGRNIGTGYEVCRWVTGTESLCVGVYRLVTGTIVYEGLSTGGYLAVTGGTGRYRGAYGQIERSNRTIRISIN